MKPEIAAPQMNIRANCPDCGGARTTFETQQHGQSFGVIIFDHRHEYEGRPYSRTLYQLLRCAGCGRGGLSVIHDNGNPAQGLLGEFFPRTIDRLPIPGLVPTGIKNEFEEAEKAASVGAWRAASALLRSTLEKTLRHNGYVDGSLKERIDQAAQDGAITAARSKRAHDDIRLLGNDILHDDWREVTEDEFDQSHKYSQRVLEDLYDDRPSVESLLREKGRLPRT
jgi:hypothetical protein